MRRLRSFAVLAAILLVAGAIGAAAPANAAATATLAGTVTDFTGTLNPDGVPVVVAYSASGKQAFAAGLSHDPVNRTIRFRFPGIKPGAYKVSLSISFDFGAWGEGNWAPNNATFFYSTHGPTASWSKASFVHLTAGRTTSVTLKASPGVHLRVRLEGSFGDGGPGISAYPVGAPSGVVFRSVTQGEGASGLLTSTALLPGRYRIGALMADGLWYYTGDGRRATRTLSHAKVITITAKSKSPSLGAFLAR